MVVKTGVSLPDKVYDQLLKLATSMGYTSISKAVRDAIELFIAFNRWWIHKGPVTGTLQVLVSARDDKAITRMEEAEEDYQDVVHTVVKVRASSDMKLYIIIVRGDGAKVKELYKKLANTRGVISIQAALVPYFEEEKA